jgi:hypothetical protein
MTSMIAQQTTPTVLAHNNNKHQFLTLSLSVGQRRRLCHGRVGFETLKRRWGSLFPLHLG